MRQSGDVLFCEILPEPGTVRSFTAQRIRMGGALTSCFNMIHLNVSDLE